MRLHAPGGIGMDAKVTGKWRPDRRGARLRVDLDRLAGIQRLALDRTW